MDTVAELRVPPPRDIAPVAFLPRETPLAMTAQPLRPTAPRPLASQPPSVWPRRTLILAGTVLMTMAGCDEMYEVLKIGGVTALEAIVLVLFVLLFAWIAFSFMSSLAGFVVLLFRRKDALRIDPAAPLPELKSRIAMLLPTYNEDPHRVMARLQAMYELVERPGTGRISTGSSSQRHHRSRDLDRRGGGIPAAARRPVGAISALLPAPPAKHRAQVRQHRRLGARASAVPTTVMLILDADSLMTGDTIVRLAAAMERASRCRPDPDAADRGQRATRCSRACSSSPAASMAR